MGQWYPTRIDVGRVDRAFGPRSSGNFITIAAKVSEHVGPHLPLRPCLMQRQQRKPIDMAPTVIVLAVMPSVQLAIGSGQLKSDQAFECIQIRFCCRRIEQISVWREMRRIPFVQARKHWRDVFLQQRFRLARRPLWWAVFGHGGFPSALLLGARGRKQPRKGQDSDQRPTDQHIAPSSIHYGRSGAIGRRRPTSCEGIVNLGFNSFSIIDEMPTWAGKLVHDYPHSRHSLISTFQPEDSCQFYMRPFLTLVV